MLSFGRPSFTGLLIALVAVGMTIPGAGPAAADCGSDPGDDDLAHTTPLDGCGTHAAAIDCAGDVDFYSFQTGLAGEYTFTVTAMYPAVVTLWTDTGSITDGSGTLTRTLEGSTFYKVSVEPGIGGQTFTYDLEISGCDSACGTDPGDDGFATATNFPGCTTHQAAFDCLDDVDVYRFVPTQEGEHVIETLGGSDTVMTLFDGSQGQLATDDDSGADRNARISHYLYAGQTYYVWLEEYSGIQGVYELRVSCPGGGNCGDDPADDHPAYAGTLAGCGTTSARIDCAGDVDYSWFQAPVAGAYTFAVSANYAVRVSLFDSASQPLGSDTSSVVLSLAQSDGVYVMVQADGGSWDFPYTLEVTGCDAGCGSDPGNDHLAAATPLAGCGTTDAAIDCVGDADYYAFTPSGSGPYVFETSGSTDTFLKLYDANGDVIATDDDGGSGTNSRIEHDLVGGSRYSVSVTEYNDDATGAYSLEVTGCGTAGCGNDPGDDTIATASALTGCGTYSASIDCAGDADFYAFTPPSSGAYVFETSGATDTVMSLYDASGAEIASDDDGGSGLNSRIEHDLVGGARYTVSIVEYGADGTGDYLLDVSGCDSGGCGNDPGDDTLADARTVPDCGTHTGAIDCAGDLDHWSFTAPSAGRYTFTAQGANQTYVSLYEPGGTFRNGGVTSASLDIPAGDTIVARVQANSSGDQFSYSFEVSGCGSAGCGGDPGDDTIATATALSGCATYSAEIDCPGDVDFYAFTPPASGTYVFETSGSTDTVMTLYDDSAGQVASDDDGGSGLNSRIEHALVGGARYTVSIAEFGGDHTGSYLLDVSGCGSGGCGSDPGDDDFSSAVEIAGCGATSAAIDCVGDVDVSRFVAPSSGSYTFTLQAGFDALLELHDPTFAPMGQSASHLTADLQSGAAYYVVVRSPGGLTGPYDLSVAGCASGGCPGDEEGDTNATAWPLSGCGAFDAAFDCAGDVDYFELTPPSGGEYVFETTGGVDTMMWLETSAGQTVAFDDDGGAGLGSRIVHDLVAGTRYALRLEEYGGDDTGAYRLAVSGCGGSTCSGDGEGDSPADATSFPGCGTLDAAFDCADDVDVFRFQTPAAGDYVFETSGQRDTVLRLLDGSGAEIDADDDGGVGGNSRAAASLAKDQVVFVELTEKAGASGPYGLTITGCDPGSAADFRYVVTAVAKVAGAAGTNWVSDLMLLNIGQQPATVTVSLWLTGQSNPSPERRTLTLAAGEHRRRDDVIASLFGRTEGAAALHLDSPQPLAVASRTYNDVPGGTYGQFIPGVSDLTAIEAGERAVLGSLVETATYRTNLGVVNPTDTALTITATFYGADGLQLGAVRTWTVPAHGAIQRNRVLNEVSASPVAGAWVHLQADRGEFFAYASVVDGGTGDPVYRPARVAPEAAADVAVPGIAKVAGAAGTNWVSDLSLLNSSATKRSVKVQLWHRDAPNDAPEERSLTIGSMQLHTVDDVLATLFGCTEGASALQVSAGAGMTVEGRTYNLVPDGTYGQFIAGMAPARAVSPAAEGYLVTVREDALFRANLGLVNPFDRPATVEVSLHAGDGARIGAARRWNLAPSAVVQVNRVVESFTSQDVPSGYLVVAIAPETPNGQVHAYVSVVDGASGDPVFEPASLAPIL